MIGINNRLSTRSILCFNVIALLVLLTASTGGVEAVTCYRCSGNSGITDVASPLSNCGLPFKDNSSIPAGALPTVTCNGKCVTQVIFTAGSTITDIYRTCTDAPVTDGCVYSETSGRQSWSCIKTCNADKCNTGSDGATLAPPAVTRLLAIAVACMTSFVKWSSLN